MKKLFPAVVSIFLLFPFLNAQEKHEHKQEGQGKEIKVHGEILDLACYADHEAKGEKHKKCALMCVQSGAPMGILSDDGVVYLLVGSHEDEKPYEKAKEYAAENVTVKGKLTERNGLKAIVVREVIAAKNDK